VDQGSNLFRERWKQGVWVGAISEIKPGFGVPGGKTLQLYSDQLEVNGRLLVGSIQVEIELGIPVQDQGAALEPKGPVCGRTRRIDGSESDLISGNRNSAEFGVGLSKDLEDRLILAIGKNRKGEGGSFDLNQMDDGLWVGLVCQGENLGSPGSYERLKLRGARAVIGAGRQKDGGPEKENTKQERTSRNQSHATLATPEKSGKDGPSSPNLTVRMGKRQENSGFPLWWA